MFGFMMLIAVISLFFGWKKFRRTIGKDGSSGVSFTKPPAWMKHIEDKEKKK